MAKKRRKRRRRRSSRLAPVLVALLLIILVGAAGIITSAIRRYTPSDARMDLADYYQQSGEDELSLILQDKIADSKGRIEDGTAYIPYTVVTEDLDGRFYWDQETQQMLYTLPEEILEIQPESNTYLLSGKTVTEDYPIVRQIDGEYYIALDFLEQYMEIQGTVYEDPARAVIFYKWGKAETVEATEETQIRYQGGIKSPILKDLEQGEEMLLLEELDNWSRVMTRDGIDGYVENGSLSSVGEMEYTYTGSYEEDFTSLTRDHKINLAWHQVTSEAANQAFASDTQNMTGVNVISPTWFSVTSTQGNISSLASSDYVSQAHAKGLEVWGLIDNFDDEVSTLDTLSVRSARQHIIDMLLSEAKRVDLDGINVDFEALTEEEAPHFIQFIRELSVACRNNGLVLSVDNPVPQYTAFYNRKEQGIVADYVIIMGYDEHTVGSETAGSVASLPFVEEGIAQTLSEVPKEKVINGIPFYTRLWTEANNGMVTSEVCSMDQADAYVEKYNMEVYWNTDVSQNYAEAVTDSGVLKMWLEDEESLEEKMKLIQKYELAGVAEWKLGFERDDVWKIISSYVQ
ncbi:MAG TPA: glycosyl hydrolase family 18 [Candidatus Blautia stercorigallinarum]|uniref:Glycosyl hydrolase family 18 n=1 Tax=Candidatus Blautia stercorigallinarum TaxID=2838501 RepID=A0A9D1TFW0_9FIRM|nr:glycosyl hydrolase family 18 [Candidatus Blautia stercorigallinarum]